MKDLFFIILFSASFSLYAETFFKGKSFICEAEPDGIELEIINKHIIKVHTAAVEDDYFRIITNQKNKITAERVFFGHKISINGSWTSPSGYAKLALEKVSKSLVVTVDYSKKKQPNKDLSSKYVCKKKRGSRISK